MCSEHDDSINNLIEDTEEFQGREEALDILGNIETIVGNVIQDNIHSVSRSDILFEGFVSMLDNPMYKEQVGQRIGKDIDDVRNLLKDTMNEDNINKQIFIAYIHTLMVPAVEHDGFYKVDNNVIDEFHAIVSQLNTHVPGREMEQTYDVTILLEDHFEQSLFNLVDNTYYFEHPSIVSMIKNMNSVDGYFIIRTIVDAKVYVTAYEMTEGKRVSLNKQNIIDIYGDIHDDTEVISINI